MSAPTKTFTVSLKPELTAELDRVGQEETAAAVLANHTKGETHTAALDRHTTLRDQRRALEDDIAGAARIITVTRLTAKLYARLVVEHPPRTGDPYDARMGFNTDTFDGPLMDASITTVTDATGAPTPLVWADLSDTVSFASYQEIVTGTIGLNTSRDAVPFSLDDWLAHRT